MGFWQQRSPLCENALRRPSFQIPSKPRNDSPTTFVSPLPPPLPPSFFPISPSSFLPVLLPRALRLRSHHEQGRHHAQEHRRQHVLNPTPSLDRSSSSTAQPYYAPVAAPTRLFRHPHPDTCTMDARATPQRRSLSARLIETVRLYGPLGFTAFGGPSANIVAIRKVGRACFTAEPRATAANQAVQSTHATEVGGNRCIKLSLHLIFSLDLC